MAAKETSNGEYICGECGVVFESAEKLEAHAEQEHGSEM